jgi:hypothetical protein
MGDAAIASDGIIYHGRRRLFDFERTRGERETEDQQTGNVLHGNVCTETETIRRLKQRNRAAIDPRLLPLENLIGRAFMFIGSR